MVLNLINIIEVAVVWILLIPHLIFATRSAEGMVRCENKIVNLAAQIGRYASMLLMVLPLGIMKFGFSSDEGAVLYFVINALLLLAYIFAWVFYFKNRSFKLEIAITLLEAAVFFTCGILLSHLFLVGSSLLFAIGNILVSVLHKKEENFDD